MPRCQEQAEDRPREQELQLRGERARAVPAATAVKELLSARAQRRENVLEVRCRSRKRTEGGRIERAAPGREKSDRPNPAPDLEAAAAAILAVSEGRFRGRRTRPVRLVQAGQAVHVGELRLAPADVRLS